MAEIIQPRPAQQEILKYQTGTMGVSAVPGSGKTWTLSLLASELIQQGRINADQEILIVTLVNSAVHNFSQRISRFLSQQTGIPSLGYRVRTLHGLANDIVNERPDLVGLDASYQIIDDREAVRIRRGAVSEWLREHPEGLDDFLLDDLSEYKRTRLRREQIPGLIDQIALQFIRTAKDLQLSPQAILEKISQDGSSFQLAAMGAEIYTAYQRDLAYRGALDFDDLIRYALEVLQHDRNLLGRLRYKWPYILEDEAQDSSRMQERILSLLAGPEQDRNWVRVGDPNQAIYESFTTADPRLLIEFINKADDSKTLPNSGRSSQSIINLANYLCRWTTESHPEERVRDALVPIEIIPAPEDDVQTNPSDRPDLVHLYQKGLSPQEEIKIVAASAAQWLEEHPEKTAAVLVPRNQRGKILADYLLKHHGVEAVEYLNSTLTTRKTSGALVIILDYLNNPTASSRLARVYQVWRREDQQDEDAWKDVERISNYLSEITMPEAFFDPDISEERLDSLLQVSKLDCQSLQEFRAVLQRWQNAVLLPIDQLILTLSGDLFTDPAELAIAHKLAYFLRQLSNQHPDWTLPDLADELKVLARNERRFFSFAEEEGFNPDQHRGRIVITTAHKAKGLEWDRVYLLAVNSYNFPSNADNDRFISEKWFIKKALNLPAEALAQLEFLSGKYNNQYRQGEATLQARLDYVRERLRLLYVAITRARQELIITWNTGRKENAQPAAAFVALQEFWNR